jgi:alkyldihydroxyacetonephosphate synthase
MHRSVGEWLAEGAPGAPSPWSDPVDHLVAGYTVELANGAALAIHPCPRRAVGPDLYALFHGTGGRVGRIHSAYLRARDPKAPPPLLESRIDPHPSTDAAEQTWIDRLLDAAAHV